MAPKPSRAARILRRIARDTYEIMNSSLSRDDLEALKGEDEEVACGIEIVLHHRNTVQQHIDEIFSAATPAPDNNASEGNAARPLRIFARLPEVPGDDAGETDTGAVADETKSGSTCPGGTLAD